MNILLIRSPNNTNGYTWHELLESAGHTVYPVESWSSGNKLPQNIDLCLPLPGTNDYVDRSNGRLDAVELAEQTGIPMVNSYQSIASSSDKYLAYAVWQKIELLQPATYQLNELNKLPNGLKPPFIIKPSVGHSGENVSLANSLKQAKHEAKGKDFLVQSYIPEPACLRLIASSKSVLYAYERWLPGAVAVNVARGATRHRIEPSAEMEKLACKMVESLSGGLMGVDILQKDGRLYALEANVAFGFDKYNEELKQKLLAHIESLSEITQTRLPAAVAR